VTDQLTALRQSHSCPDCSGSFKSPASHPADVLVGPALKPRGFAPAPLTSPYDALRALLWYRSDLYDGRLAT